MTLSPEEAADLYESLKHNELQSLPAKELDRWLMFRRAIKFSELYSDWRQPLYSGQEGAI